MKHFLPKRGFLFILTMGISPTTLRQRQSKTKTAERPSTSMNPHVQWAAVLHQHDAIKEPTDLNTSLFGRLELLAHKQRKTKSIPFAGGGRAPCTGCWYPPRAACLQEIRCVITFLINMLLLLPAHSAGYGEAKNRV